MSAYRKFTILATLESFVQGLLWTVLCLIIIDYFDLQDLWFLVCVVVLILEIGIQILHQRLTFPLLITEHLGYEPNEKLEEMKKIQVEDHVINIIIMFAIVYYCVGS